MKKPISILLFVILIGVVGYAFYLANKSNSQQLVSLEESKEVTNVTEDKQKTDIEQLSEVGEKLLEKGEQWSKKQEKKDSIKRTNRGEVLVYQIGMPKGSPEELWDNYKKLQ